MKKVKFLACLLFGMALVISCSSDDDNSGGSSGGGAINNGTVNEHQYVDLGLSVRWATSDWGASQSGPGMYNHGVEYSYKLENINYDVVTAEWGSPWRRPTVEEFQELVEKCTWSIDMTLGGNGCAIITGPNGNKMNMPVESSYISSSYTTGLGFYTYKLEINAYKKGDNRLQNRLQNFDELKEEIKIKAQPSGYLLYNKDTLIEGPDGKLYTLKEFEWWEHNVVLYFLSKDELYIYEIRTVHNNVTGKYIRPVAPY
jgi:hypothetical protein